MKSDAEADGNGWQKSSVTVTDGKMSHGAASVVFGCDAAAPPRTGPSVARSPTFNVAAASSHFSTQSTSELMYVGMTIRKWLQPRSDEESYCIFYCIISGFFSLFDPNAKVNVISTKLLGPLQSLLPKHKKKRNWKMIEH